MLSEAGEARSDSPAQSKHPYLHQNSRSGNALPRNVTPATETLRRKGQYSYMPRDRKYYCVYIMGSLSGTLYIRISGNLYQRVFQHKFHHFEGFTARYDVTRLLYWESYDDVHKAIGRETQLKGWSRAKKIALIVRRNPHWIDLAAEWYPWMKSENGRDASTPR